MGKDSKISWTTHTFNTHWGCVKVSPECDHCYADSFSHRLGMKLWGKDADRRFFKDAHWKDPAKWDAAAKKAGERHRVFCSSMADVFEDREDLRPVRERLWALILATPHLDWLLLTKRPQNIRKMLPSAWLNDPQPNVWLGTTCGVPESLWRVDELIKLTASVLFLSMEPLLAEVALGTRVHDVDWVIAGAESGPGARPCEIDWVRNLRDECSIAKVPFFWKQHIVDGIKIETPELDGRKWIEVPAPMVIA